MKSRFFEKKGGEMTTNNTNFTYFSLPQAQTSGKVVKNEVFNEEKENSGLKMAELRASIEKNYRKNAEGKLKFKQKLDPNRSFLLKKQTEDLNSTLARLKIFNAPDSIKYTPSIDEFGDVPF
jgi:hypothetical protein